MWLTITFGDVIFVPVLIVVFLPSRVVSHGDVILHDIIRCSPFRYHYRFRYHFPWTILPLPITYASLYLIYIGSRAWHFLTHDVRWVIPLFQLWLVQTWSVCHLVISHRYDSDTGSVIIVTHQTWHNVQTLYTGGRGKYRMDANFNTLPACLVHRWDVFMSFRCRCW